MDSNQPRYINPYLAGVLLGCVLFGTFAMTQSGLGASGGISRIQVALMKLISEDHVDKVGYFSAMGGGSRCSVDHSSVLMLAGTFLGGMISALVHRRWRVEIFKGPQITNKQRLLFALLGGTIMGYGARMARGCTSGQALSGGAVLSVGSWVFMFSVFASAYALAFFLRRLWNAPSTQNKGDK